MHKLDISITVKGSITEQQLAKMYISLHAEIDNYLKHLPIKEPALVIKEAEAICISN